jgi:hypothetical protein
MIKNVSRLRGYIFDKIEPLYQKGDKMVTNRKQSYWNTPYHKILTIKFVDENLCVQVKPSDVSRKNPYETLKI